MALIEVEHIWKIYAEGEMETTALHDINLSIEEGEFVSIIGPSGSGKSTLLHILGFLDHPTRGTYRFNKKTIDEYTSDDLARVRNKNMGFVFQAFNLLPRMSVRENVKLPFVYSGVAISSWDSRVQKALETVGLTHRIDYRASKLSGGEKQHVAIARALVNDPKVIFADEPTGNLDSKSGTAVIDLLEMSNRIQGKTVILITHDETIASRADRTIVMKDGQIEKDTRNSRVS